MSHVVTRLLAAQGLVLSVLLQACGGGSETPLPPLAAQVAPTSVRLEGCVVDQYYVPNEGVPVRVKAADGRTLAVATSGRMGEFVVHVPAGQQAAITVDQGTGEPLATPALDRDRVVDACLVVRNEAAVQ